jgi:hypothetical protein
MTDFGKDSLKQIDLVMSKELLKLNELISDLNFTQIAEFTLDENLSSICDLRDDYPGLYLFEIKNDNLNVDISTWINDFASLWAHPDYHKRFVSGIKKKRVIFHTKMLDWIPIYLGKNKSVKSRINEHLNKGIDKTTFAMKLKARTNIYGHMFRVSTLEIKVDNYNLIVPHIESHLRERINPIIGKQ